MELQDIISSSLRKDMKELQQFQQRLKEIKEECNKNIQRFKRNIDDINPGTTPWNMKAFQAFSSLFGEDVEYFAPRVNERTMQKHEGMISKDASKIDNNVAGASHDED
ncbi:hypothetical protein Tco_0791577, partial [Tanacetum coccineum]